MRYEGCIDRRNADFRELFAVADSLRENVFLGEANIQAYKLLPGLYGR